MVTVIRVVLVIRWAGSRAGGEDAAKLPWARRPGPPARHERSHAGTVVVTVAAIPKPPGPPPVGTGGLPTIWPSSVSPGPAGPAAADAPRDEPTNSYNQLQSATPHPRLRRRHGRHAPPGLGGPWKTDLTINLSLVVKWPVQMRRDAA